MEIREYKLMYQVEDTHFWYKGMRKITKTLLDKYLPKNKPLKILDAGCGTGRNILFLENYGQVSGFDISPYAINFCKKRGLKNINKASIDKIPYDDNAFNLVTCFDVIGQREVNNVEDSFKEFYRILKPGGRLLIRIAAYDWLKGPHDQIVHTKHRYNIKELTNILHLSKFKILKITYANTFLFPLVMLRRIISKLTNDNNKLSDVRLISPIVNFLFQFPLYLEAFLIKYFNLPFGLSIIAVAKKK